LFAEGIILFDEIEEKILFADVPPEFSSRRQISMGGMLINLAKKLSSEFKGGEVNSILIAALNKWICVTRRERMYLIVLFSKLEEFEQNGIIKKTEEIFDDILKNIRNRN